MKNAVKRYLVKGAAMLPLLLMFSCASSCTLLGSNDPDNIRVTVLWRTPVSADSNQSMSMKNGIIYFGEQGTMGFIAIDANTGNVLWRDRDRADFTAMPVFLDDGTIGMPFAARIAIYRADGFSHWIKITGEGKMNKVRFNVATDGEYIYYPASEPGLCRYRPADAIETADGWEVEAELLYPKPEDLDGDGWIRWATPVVHGNVLYSGVGCMMWGEPGIYFAVDLSTKTILWETTGSYLESWQDWPVSYIDGKIVLNDSAFGVINASDGSFVYEHGERYSGGGNSGFFLYNDRLYYTSGRSPLIVDNPYNILCVDFPTGELVWDVSYDGNHGSNPVCHNGITYVAAQGELRLLNAENGELLGRDKSVKGDPWQLCNVLMYEDTLIFRNSSELVCVKMDFRVNSQGKLRR